MSSSNRPENEFVIGQFTVLLSRLRAGEHEAFDRLFSLACRQLHRRARPRMVASGPQMTLDMTGLLRRQTRSSGSRCKAW